MKLERMLDQREKRLSGYAPDEEGRWRLFFDEEPQMEEPPMTWEESVLRLRNGRKRSRP
jgi:hypothetical protein